MLLKLSLVTLCFINVSVSYRILGILPYKGTSHNLVMLPLFDELAARGHDVNVISYFPKKNPVRNYTSLPLKLDPNEQLRGFFRIDEIKKRNPVIEGIELTRTVNDEMETAIKSPYIQKVIEEKWDAVIVEYFNTDMFAAVAHLTGAPLILFHTSAILPFQKISLGEPLDPSYIPHPYTSRSVPMTFFDRLINTLEVYYHAIYFYFDMRIQGQRLAEKYLGPLPQMAELMKNASLFLVNTHPSFHGAVPLSPRVVQVGGIHVKPRNPLPQNVEEILEQTEAGVVYFSMGSVLRGDSLEENTFKQFVTAFSKLPLDVLWKYEGTIDNKPRNIHLMPWLPQRDLLGHAKVLLFISHCGLLSIEEALTEGVPVICIPIFGDQLSNAQRVRTLGIGETIDFWNVSASDLQQTIVRVLEQPSYKENALKAKNAFNDRPASPMDTAIYWVEYVVRHRGAHHLKSEARQLPLFALHNLDVWFALMSSLMGIFYISLGIVRSAFSLLCRRKSADELRQELIRKNN